MEALDTTAEAQVKAVVRLVQEVFGEAAIAVYLYGSAVVAGLRPDSDLDLLAVTRRRTTEAERRAMITALLQISRSGGDVDGKRHLEVTVVAQPGIKPWRYPPPLELQYGDWWRREFERGDLAPWTSPNADLAVLLTAVRAEAVPLFGPPATQVFDPVPLTDLDRALRDVLPDLLADLDDDTRNVLLTLARVWITLATGAIVSKDVAADWAAERLPDRLGAGLRRARAAYVGATQDAWEGEAMAAARVDAAAIVAAIHAIVPD